jgi:CRISPR-associated protein Csb2
MMFAIAVDLLCGRYTATQFNDRTRPEWPPHPARLFSAMVAAWADADEPDPAERSALQWLEQQDPPAIRCGLGRGRQVVTHFVPVNDPAALTRGMSRSYEAVGQAARRLREAEQSGDQRSITQARAAAAKAGAKAAADAARAGTPGGRESGTVIAAVLEVLPENRGKQGRTYPSVIPDESVIWFAWPGAEPGEQQRAALDGLLSRVARLGHSSTLVACRCADEAPPATWAPARDQTGTRLRVPRAGLLGHLEEAFASHGGQDPRTLPAGMACYQQPRAVAPPRRSPLLGGDWYVLGISGRRLPSAVQALAIARATRASLLAHADQPPTEILSGHQRRGGSSGPTPPLDRPHLAVVPLPNAGNPHSDGAVSGIGLVLPADCPDRDREAVEHAIRAWSEAGFELVLPGLSHGQPVRLMLHELGVDRASGSRGWLESALTTRRKTTTRNYWCRPARRWLSVTPIALDRFPGNLRNREQPARERAEAEAAASIARACVFAGLADTPGQVRVSIRPDSPLAGVPAGPGGRQSPGRRQFPGYQAGSGTPRACVHAEIEFDEPPEGPVLVGAGRYLGYGLCLPRPAADGRPS